MAMVWIAALAALATACVQCTHWYLFVHLPIFCLVWLIFVFFCSSLPLWRLFIFLLSWLAKTSFFESALVYCSFRLSLWDFLPLTPCSISYLSKDEQWCMLVCIFIAMCEWVIYYYTVSVHVLIYTNVVHSSRHVYKMLIGYTDLHDCGYTSWCIAERLVHQ